MNKLEQLQDQYGVDNVYLVTSWVYMQSKFFRYYVSTTGGTFTSGTFNLDTSRLECKTLVEGVESGALSEPEVRDHLIKMNKDFPCYHAGDINWPQHFGKFLAGNSRYFKDFDFKSLPVETKDGIYYLLRVFKDDKRKVWVELQSSDCCYFKDKATFVERLMNHDKWAEDYTKWREERFRAAPIKDLCKGVDVRVSRFIKTVLCK